MKSPYPISPIKELSAAHITHMAINMLTMDHVTCWRQPNNVAKRRRGTVKKGIPDILGYDNSSGKMVACEVKKMGDILSDEQKEFLEELDFCGGKALIAHQVSTHVVLTPYIEYIKKHR